MENGSWGFHFVNSLHSFKLSRRDSFTALLLLVLLHPGHGGHEECTQKFIQKVENIQTIKITSPIGDLLHETRQVMVIELEPATVLEEDVAFALMLDGGLVAYGLQWAKEGLVEIPVPPDGEHEVTLAITSDTGESTWKRDSNICRIHTARFVSKSIHSPDTFQQLQVESPRTGERLLVGETRLLEFKLNDKRWLAIRVNGREVREADVYEEGTHSTVMDFLDVEEENTHGGKLDASPEASRFDLEILTWDISDEEREESNVKERASIHFHLANEPPNVMFQFPPDKYVYNDPSNVNVALLVTYFAFHRFPSIANGFVKVLIDWDHATTAKIVRDSEGVFEITMSLAQPFNRPGWHHIQVQLSGPDQQPLGGPVELLYKVDEQQGGVKAGEGKEQRVLSIPIGSWSELHQVELDSLPSDSEGHVICGGHGTCVGSPRKCECVCEGDWIGSSCNVSLEVEVEYFPQVMPVLSDSRWALSASLLNGSRELLHRLQNLHNTSNCSREKVFVFEYNDQGLAAVVSDATVQLSYSFARSRATVFQGEWTYGLHKGCRHASGVACHFHPHFDCEASQDFQQPEFESHPRDVIPAEYSGRGSFWWYSHLSHYLLQENFDFQLKVPPPSPLVSSSFPSDRFC